MFRIRLKTLSAPGAATPSALDLVVARFDREHDQHVSPIVGCYACLHNEPGMPRAPGAALLAA